VCVCVAHRYQKLEAAQAKIESLSHSTNETSEKLISLNKELQKVEEVPVCVCACMYVGV